MKVSGWIENEKHVYKELGGRRSLEVSLDYEEEGQSWECNTLSHRVTLLFYLDNEGKPHLNI
mgnify:CR=1 FL=1